jgi:hypothetical protein
MIIYDNKPLDRLKHGYLDGTCYIGVASGENVLVEASNSAISMYRRPGDEGPYFGLGTKGVETRERHIEAFLRSRHSWLLFLDGDMPIPQDALERLRSHGLPCVSGYYTQRKTAQVRHIWFEDDPTFSWPMLPFRGEPERNRLYRLGATGFGIWLIHRCVFEEVRKLIKHEPFCLQHDMAVWPYDLKEVLAGRESLRPLRGQQAGEVGADVRLSFYIRQAGFEVWGDANVQCGHYVNYPLGLNDWRAQAPEDREAAAYQFESDVQRMRHAHAAHMAEVTA